MQAYDRSSSRAQHHCPAYACIVQHGVLLTALDVALLLLSDFAVNVGVESLIRQGGHRHTTISRRNAGQKFWLLMTQQRCLTKPSLLQRPGRHCHKWRRRSTSDDNSTASYGV